MSERADRDEADDRELSMIDLSIAQADDALLDALSGADPKIADELGEAELNALLLSWRREVDSEPMPELVDTDAAVTTIRSAALARKRGPGDRKRRMLVPVAAAAAVLAITFSGTSVAARDAQPGDTLWGLTKVLYADKARSVQAATDVRADFELARIAIAQGQLEEARQALEEAKVALGEVAAEDNRDELAAEHDALMSRVDEEEKPPPEPTTTPAPAESTASSSSTTPEPTEPSIEPVQPQPEPTTPSAPPSGSTEPEPTTAPSSTSSSEAEPTGSTSGMGTTSGTGSGTSDTGPVGPEPADSSG